MHSQNSNWSKCFFTMKSPEEKIQFKNHFFKLGQGRIIPVSDEKFWLVFWNTPRELADIFELITPFDVQTVRDQNLPNILLFVHVLALKILEYAANFSSRKHLELLNCLRFLAKIIPFIYELPNYVSEIDPLLFWSREFTPLQLLLTAQGPTLDNSATIVIPNDSPVLGVSLATSLVDLLLMPGFTIDEVIDPSVPKLSLWEPGIGASGKYQTPNSIHDSNRVEVLRALTVLISLSFYDKPSNLISQGSRFLTFMVTCLPKTTLVSLVCSLFNITCRSARKPEECGLIYENKALSEVRHLCVSYSVQLFTSLLVYPIPSLETTKFLLEHKLTISKKPLNVVRVFFGKLSRESELLFMVSHLLNILKYPLNSQDGRPSKHQPSPWALEASIVLWELLQCNKNFRTTIAERLVITLSPYLLYHVFAFHDTPQLSNLVKISANFLFYISSEESWVEALVSPMSESVIEAFPPEFSPLHVTTTRDFLIVQICDLLKAVCPGGSNNVAENLQMFLMPTLVEILFNITPVVNRNIAGTNIDSRKMTNVNPCGGLTYLACKALTHLLIKFSTKTFLLEGPRNAEMLALILRTLCTTAIKHPAASRMLLFSFMKNEKIYDGIWSVIYGLGNEYFYGENMKLMNVQEDDETHELEEGFITPTYASLSNFSVASPDQHSLISVATNEDNFAGFKDPLNNSLTNSMISILPEESDEAEEDVERAIVDAWRPPLPTGMSLKAKEKLPQDSTLSQTWGGNDALRIIITIIIPQIKLVLEDLLTKEGESFDTFFIVRQIELSSFKENIELNRAQINYDFLPDTPAAKLPFRWNSLTLGWYASTIYFDIYNDTETIKRFVRANMTLMNNISSSIAVLSKFASNWSGLGSSAPNVQQDQIVIDYVERGSCWVNLWEATSVKLFRIKANDNDKFFNALGLKFGSTAPNNGSVNEITNSLARRFSDFRIRTNLPPTAHPQTIEELFDGARLSKRNSVSSLHSLNTLNRTRSNTPRNSISN